MLEKRQQWPSYSHANRAKFLSLYRKDADQRTSGGILCENRPLNPIRPKNPSVTQTSEPDARLVIVAVMATMDRCAIVTGCIKALAAQTRPPDRVIVADNKSSDDTPAILEALTHLPFELTVHRMASNLGNAGGVEEAMTRAFTEGADAVWILDDDSWPENGALQALLNQGWRPDVVRHPLQVIPGSDALTWPMLVSDQQGGWRLISTLGNLPDEEVIKTKASWTGAIISREIFEQVGPVNGRLFIRGEDEEYPWRIEKAGFSFEAIRSAVMNHPGPKDLTHWRFLGRSLFLEPSLADIKLFYKVRNMVWLKKAQKGRFEALLMAVAYLGGISYLDGLSRLPTVLKAIRDGWNARLGPARL